MFSKEGRMFPFLNRPFFMNGSKRGEVCETSQKLSHLLHSSCGYSRAELARQEKWTYGFTHSGFSLSCPCTVTSIPQSDLDLRSAIRGLDLFRPSHGKPYVTCTHKNQAGSEGAVCPPWSDGVMWITHKIRPKEGYNYACYSKQE